MGKKSLFLIAITVFVCSAAQSSQSKVSAPVLPPDPNARVACHTLAEWSALWWAWAFSFPGVNIPDVNNVNPIDNPLLDTFGEKVQFGDVGPVFFLAGGIHGDPVSTLPKTVTLHATLPPRKFIFFPVFSAYQDRTGFSPDATIDNLYSQVEMQIVEHPTIHASVDGVPVADIQEHRIISPVFSYTLQSDNLLNANAGTIFPVVANGWYLMLRPLPPGHHVINFGGSNAILGEDIQPDERNFTYDITVDEKAFQRTAAVLFPGPTVLSTCPAKKREKPDDSD